MIPACFPCATAFFDSFTPINAFANPDPSALALTRPGVNYGCQPCIIAA
jgi:hypothetical protein